MTFSFILLVSFFLKSDNYPFILLETFSFKSVNSPLSYLFYAVTYKNLISPLITKGTGYLKLYSYLCSIFMGCWTENLKEHPSIALMGEGGCQVTPFWENALSQRIIWGKRFPRHSPVPSLWETWGASPTMGGTSLWNTDIKRDTIYMSFKWKMLLQCKQK